MPERGKVREGLPGALDDPALRDTAKPGDSPPALRALIVDDDPVVLRLLERAIKNNGYDVTACSDAESAWEVCKSEFYPLVVLDWLMPGMDGLTLCRKLRGLPDGDRPVILVVTGNDRPEHLGAVLEAGADDYVTKPIDIKLLAIRLAVARQQIAMKKERALATKGLEMSLAKVKRAKREWETTADALPQVVCLLDDKSRVVRANMTVEEWNLSSVSSLTGREFHELFHENCTDPDCYLRSLWKRAHAWLSEEKPVECEVEDRILGRFFRMQFRPILTRREGGIVEEGTFAVAVIEDITERKRMEMELEHAREQEIDIGSRIQKSLLIGTPPENLTGMEISALTIPSQRIDGDFYAFFRPNEHCLDVIVGDVMGKGIPAALIGAATKSHFLGAMSHLISLSTDRRLPEPMEVVSYVHREMANRLIELESFVTLVYARFDLIRRSIKFVDCGHPNTLQFRKTLGDCHALDGVNMPLGFVDRESYRQIEVGFNPGDSFLFYSDGVIEAQVETGELFGEERLTELFCRNGTRSPAELTDRIRSAVVDFAGSETFSDDLTCIAVRINDRQEEVPGSQATLTVSSSLRELEAIRTFVREHARYEGKDVLDEEDLWMLELCVTEAASNVSRHAYEGRPNERILIEVVAAEDQVGVKLHHWGKSFNPETVETPLLDGSESGGFGVFIIENSMDEVSYVKNEKGRNSICLVKTRKKP